MSRPAGGANEPARGDPPVACRLSSPALQRRIEWIRRHILARARVGRPRPGAIELALPAEAELRARVAEWIALEGECCPFLTFRVTDLGADLLAVAVDGPAGSDAIFDAWLPAGP